jgi:hypothetical protein
MRLLTILLLGISVVIYAVPAESQISPISECKTEDAPVFEAKGSIVGLLTGWSADTMSVRLDNEYRDPNQFINAKDCNPQYSRLVMPQASDKFIYCPTTRAGYALDPSEEGIKVHEAVLLSAFLSGREVVLVLRGCAPYGKPRIIGVGMGERIY